MVLFFAPKVIGSDDVRSSRVRRSSLFTSTLFKLYVKRKNIVKTRLVFPTKARNAEMLLAGGFNDHFIPILNVLITYEFLTVGYLLF